MGSTENLWYLLYINIWKLQTFFFFFFFETELSQGDNTFEFRKALSLNMGMVVTLWTSYNALEHS